MATGIIQKVTNDSDNGYCKMHDGTLICWGSFTTNRSQYSMAANGSMYTATATLSNVLFAQAFISAPSISVVSANNSCPIMYCKTSSSGITLLQVMRHVNNGPPDGATWNYIAVGRWK